MDRYTKITLLPCLVLAGLILFGCSGDSHAPAKEPAKEPGKGKKAKAAGLTSDGHDLLVWDEGVLDAILVKIDTLQITDSSFSGIAYFKGLKEGEIPEPGDIIASNNAHSRHISCDYEYGSVGVDYKLYFYSVRCVKG